eukprot:11390273-Alexandrium_andersonii.AAC.1
MSRKNLPEHGPPRWHTHTSSDGEEPPGKATRTTHTETHAHLHARPARDTHALALGALPSLAF